MAVREVLVFPHNKLRTKAKEVSVFDDELKTLIQDMFDTMYADDGIGLAAPQIGVDKRIVVMDVASNDGKSSEQMVLINPVITKKEGEVISNEGCLSVPEYRADVNRAEKITIEALNAEGAPVVYEADGLLAICMQHELDHLDGVLFIDYLSRLKRDRLLTKYKKYKKERNLE